MGQGERDHHINLKKTSWEISVKVMCVPCLDPDSDKITVI